MIAKPVNAPWVLVAGDFRLTGGMDKANRVLAKYLLDRGTPVHLVAHFVDPELAAHSLSTVHLVHKPLRSYFLGGPLLGRKGRSVFRSVRRASPEAILLVNGGNCVAEGVNWVHFVQSAWRPDLSQAGWRYRVRWAIEDTLARHRERAAYASATLVITNSDMTSADVLQCLGTARDGRVHRIYLGGESDWSPAGETERALRRRALGVAGDRMVALFVGALGRDDRKGLEVTLRAWEVLCQDPEWDVDLFVAGEGPARRRSESFTSAGMLRTRVRWLGYRNDIEQLLGGSDVLVSPARYEPYGLNIQEALARGVSVISSSRAGITERFPMELDALVCKREGDVDELVGALRRWRFFPEHWRELCAKLGERLRDHSWEDMARQIVSRIEDEPRPREMVASRAGIGEAER